MRASPSSRAPSTFVGRDRELAILRERLDAALVGRGSLVLIGGEAGIGKTALAETVCRDAETRGTLVLVGRCYDLTETPPYGPWVELFGRYRQADEMPPPPDAFAARGTIGVVASQAALLHQVRDFLAALAAARPVLLLLDDLHWADASSLDLLRFVARHLGALPLLLVVTYRSDELTRHPLSPLLPVLVREAAAERVDLRPLDDAAVRALIADRHRLAAPDADRLVAFVQGRAEGNALFVGEVLRSLAESGALRREGEGWHLSDLRQAVLPPLLGQVIDARVARLDGEGQRLLALAAAVGQEAALAVLGPLAGMDEEALLTAVEGAAEAGLLAETPDGLHVRFTHALVREAVYAGVSPARRRLLHRRIGEQLAAQSHPDPDAVAMHFQRAADGRAVPWLVRAGERAQHTYAWVTAAERYEAALDLIAQQSTAHEERFWLLYRIARLRRYADPRYALGRFEEARLLADQLGDGALAALARFQHGLLCTMTENRRAGMPEMREAADTILALPGADFARIASRSDRTMQSLQALHGAWMFHAALAGYYTNVLRFAERWERLEAPPATGGQDGSPYGDGWLALGIVWAAIGDVPKADAAFGRALDIYRSFGHYNQAGLTGLLRFYYLVLPYRTDRSRERHRVVADAVAAMRAAGGAFGSSPVGADAWLSVLEGRWSDVAVNDIEHWLATRMELIAAHAMLGRLYVEHGDYEGAREHVQHMLPDGPTTEPGNAVLREAVMLQEVAVDIALAAGDLAGAKEWLESLQRWLDWSNGVLGRVEGSLLWARYHRAAGDLVQARECAHRALTDATAPRQPLALLAAHRLLGELDTETGRYEDADGHLQASLALADACAAPYERALTLLATTELRAATGAMDEAKRLLGEARAVCEQLGAKPALARADALAARLDVTPPAAPSYPAGLSAREVEVLQLIAHGLTNRQVAERLFLSPRTVEQHLRTIYNKLGVATRAAAAHFAVTHGLA